MISIIRNRSSKVLTGAITIGLTGTMVCGLTLAANASGKGFTACSTKKGVLKLENSKGKCTNGASKITLGQRGKPGVNGVNGLNGTDGKDGTDGTDGVVNGYYRYAANPAFDKGTDQVTLVTLPTLPAGKYMLSGNVWLKSDQSSTAVADCFLEPEDSADVFDESDTSVPPSSSQVDLPFDAVADSDQPFSPLIECSNGNTAIFAERAVISAIPVANLDHN